MTSVGAIAPDPMPLAEEWDVLILKRVPPEQWDELGSSVLYCVKSVRDFWGVLNNVKLNVGGGARRYMFSTEGLGIFRKGLKPVWGTGGLATQSVYVKVEANGRWFHEILGELGVLLVSGMGYLPGAIGVRVVDKSNSKSRAMRLEVWGECVEGFAGHAMKWLLRLCRDRGIAVQQCESEVHGEGASK